MPYTIEWEPRGVYKRFSGVCSWAEFLRSQEAVLGDARLDDIHYSINDLQGVENISIISITGDEAEYSAAITRGSSLSNPTLKIAFVTADRRITMLAMAVRALTPLRVATFATEAEARSWCEIGD